MRTLADFGSKLDYMVVALLKDPTLPREGTNRCIIVVGTRCVRFQEVSVFRQFGFQFCCS